MDKTDPCTGMSTPNAEQSTRSEVFSNGEYFLRTIPTDTSGWSLYIIHPSRYLVLDFSSSANGAPCPNIDEQVASDTANTNWSAFGLPTPTPPAPASGCRDNVEVRFLATHAFNQTSTPLSMAIDEPQLVVSHKGGARVQWNGIYTLTYEVSLTVTPLNDGHGSVVVSTGSSDVADLKNVNNQLVGKYHMPFSLTVTPVQ